MLSPDQAQSLVESVVNRGTAAGATAADALYAGSLSSSVQVRLGELEDVSRSEGEEIGLRLVAPVRDAVPRLPGHRDVAVGPVRHLRPWYDGFERRPELFLIWGQVKSGVNRCDAPANASPVSTRPVRSCGVVAVSVSAEVPGAGRT